MGQAGSSFSTFGYYYSLLDPNDQQTYLLLRDGFFKCKKRISGFFATKNNLSMIYQYVLLDCPYLFHLQDFLYESTVLGKVVAILPRYRYDAREYKEQLHKIEMETQDFVESIKNLSDFDKEISIHDYIIKRVCYADVDEDYSHNIDGVFLNARAVCEGISKAFKYLADQVGLASLVALGKLELKEEPDEMHAWNIVNINGNYSHLDVTHDLNLSALIQGVRYDYVNLAQEEIANRTILCQAPATVQGSSYYDRQSLYAPNAKCLNTILKKTMRDQCWITFQMPIFSADEEQVDQAIVSIVKNAMEEQGGGEFTIQTVPNYERGVYSVWIKKALYK